MLIIWFWIMYCCIPTPTTDSNTRKGMICITLNMLSAAEECREPSGKCHGIVREFHIVWRVVTLWKSPPGKTPHKHACVHAIRAYCVEADNISALFLAMLLLLAADRTLVMVSVIS